MPMQFLIKLWNIHRIFIQYVEMHNVYRASKISTPPAPPAYQQLSLLCTAFAQQIVNVVNGPSTEYAVRVISSEKLSKSVMNIF